MTSSFLGDQHLGSTKISRQKAANFMALLTGKSLKAGWDLAW